MFSQIPILFLSPPRFVVLEYICLSVCVVDYSKTYVSRVWPREVVNLVKIQIIPFSMISVMVMLFDYER